MVNVLAVLVKCPLGGHSSIRSFAASPRGPRGGIHEEAKLRTEMHEVVSHTPLVGGVRMR